jgi:hypothetical protein
MTKTLEDLLKEHEEDLQGSVEDNDVVDLEEAGTLYAVHGEMGTKKKLGDFKSKDHAAQHVDKLEDKGKFPEGHDAVFHDHKTGEKHMYGDGWEKVDEAKYPELDDAGKKSATSGAKTGKGGKTEYPTVDFKKSEAKGGSQKPGMMPKLDNKMDRDGLTNKKTPVDPENYEKVKPNFEPEVVANMLKIAVTKEDISDDVKSNLDALFNGQELSEEFSAKVREIFEAAVLSVAQKHVNAYVDNLEEQYNEKFEVALQVCEEEVEAHKEELNERTDSYFDYVVEQWMEENKPVLESNIRYELTESFMKGLQNLFMEHYIDIPEDKVDVVEEMSEELDRVAAEREALIQENLELRTQTQKMLKESVIQAYASDMSEVEKEKFVSLAEHLDFDGEESFAGKLEELSETYFKPELVVESSVEDDTPLEVVEEDVKKPQRTEIDTMADRMTKFFARSSSR